MDPKASNAIVARCASAALIYIASRELTAEITHFSHIPQLLGAADGFLVSRERICRKRRISEATLPIKWSIPAMRIELVLRIMPYR